MSFHGGGRGKGCGAYVAGITVSEWLGCFQQQHQKVEYSESMPSQFCRKLFPIQNSLSNQNIIMLANFL